MDAIYPKTLMICESRKFLMMEVSEHNQGTLESCAFGQRATKYQAKCLALDDGDGRRRIQA